MTQHSGTKIKLKGVPKNGDFFSIAGGLGIGAKRWSVCTARRWWDDQMDVPRNQDITGRNRMMSTRLSPC